MTLTKAIAVVGICLATGAVLGGTIGLFIGSVFPDAYAWARGSNPVHVGVGLGIPQGMALGTLTGVLVTAIMAWHDVKTRTRPPTDDSDEG